MLDVEGPQGPGDTYTPNLVDDPMRNAHAKVGLGQGPGDTYIPNLVDNPKCNAHVEVGLGQRPYT